VAGSGVVWREAVNLLHNLTFLQPVLFRSKNQWPAWLENSHGKSSGLWLRLAKKGSGLRSVTYQEALEVALCHG